MPLLSATLIRSLPPGPSETLHQVIQDQLHILQSDARRPVAEPQPTNIVYGHIMANMPFESEIHKSWPSALVEILFRALQLYRSKRIALDTQITNFFDQRAEMIRAIDRQEVETIDLMAKLLWNVTKLFLEKLAEQQSLTVRGVFAILHDQDIVSRPSISNRSAPHMQSETGSSSGTGNGGGNRVTSHQSSILQRAFAVDRHPNMQKQKLLASNTGLTSKQVQTWFINKRTRSKAKEQRQQISARPGVTNSGNDADESNHYPDDWIQYDEEQPQLNSQYLSSY